MRAHVNVLAGVLTCIVMAAAAAQAPARGDKRLSGFEYMGPSTQAMQRDDAQNPGMLWVKDGESLWNAKAGTADRSCASCHGAAKDGMRGVAARFPRFDAASKRPINLGQQINQCRQQRQGAQPWKPESAELLGMQSYVAMQSRGMPVSPPDDARLRPHYERGEQLFKQRIGQLNLSCAQCHDGLAGGRLGGSLIPQGHANAYPLYRLEWQGMGSLERRLRNCMTGVRAEPYAYGAPEMVELELFLAARAKGMPVETPGVRP